MKYEMRGARYEVRGARCEMRRLIVIALMAMLVIACRDDKLLVYPEVYDTGTTEVVGDIVGMYVLCEGNMGSNKCTVDYLDLVTGKYNRNIYSERNPSTVMELGDVGNDIQVYGSRMWMVINCSDKVEVVDAKTCRRIGQVNIPNCRNVTFNDRYAYISSYVGPVDLNAGAQIGMVYKVDTLTLQTVATVEVGYQPEELVIVGEKLYVANSGGYIAPQYDRTVSVVDLPTMREERKIDVAPNLHRCRADQYEQLWVSSRGDYDKNPSCITWMRKNAYGKMEIGGRIDVAVSDMCIVGDSLYYYGSEWNEAAQRNTVNYGIINVRTHEVLKTNIFDAKEIAAMRMPYGIIVNPVGRDFYLMDAKNYVSSGELLHFKRDGSFDWKVRTGDIPGHGCFIIGN